MHLILEKSPSWDHITITHQGDARLYHDCFTSQDVDVFVYGYPYRLDGLAWLSAADIYRLYADKGLDFVHQVEGFFALIILDRVTPECHIVVDRCEVYTFFYARRDSDSLIIADNIQETARLLPQMAIDRLSLTEFLHIGFILGDRTLVEGVSTFQPATVCTIDCDLLVQNTEYWQFLEGETSITKEELRVRFNQHILGGFELAESVTLPLTGGVDSRTILSACLPKQERLFCYTHGLPGSEDVRVASRVARRLALNHRHYPVGDQLIRDIPAVADRMAGEFDLMSNAILYTHLPASFARVIQDTGGDTIFYSGIGGEMLGFSHFGKKPSELHSRDEYIESIIALFNTKGPYDIHAARPGDEVKSLVRESIARELDRLPADDYVMLSRLFWFKVRLGSFYGPHLRFAGTYFRLFDPFLSRGILHAARGLDDQDLLHKTVRPYIIAQNSPELAHILLSHGKKPIDQKNPLLAARYYGNRFIRGVKHLRNLVLGWGVFNTIGYFVDYGRWLQDYHRDYVREVLDYDRMLLKDFLVKDELDGAVGRFLRGDQGLTKFITNLMSVELGLRQLRDDAPIS